MNNLSLLSNIALKFTNLHDFDDQMNSVMRLLGKYYKVSRVYIFINEDENTCSNKYEWCNNGIQPQMHKLQSIPHDLIPSWKKRMLKDNIINTSDINTLEIDIQNILKPQNVKSLLSIALFIDDRVQGFIGFDQCFKNRVWKLKEVEILRIISGIISNAYTKNLFYSKLKKEQAKLKKEQTKLKNIIEGTNMGTWEWNVQTGETIFNQRWAQIIGYTLEELEPIDINTWIKYVYKEDLEESNTILNKHFRNELPYYECEARMKHKNGETVWVLDRGKVIKWDKDGKPLKMFGVHLDITKRKKLEEEIKNISIKDSLTNIYNRRYAFERLRELYSQYKRDGNIFSIAILDIDLFKNVNDTHGHLAGDFVLKEFANDIKLNIRDYDLLSRYGGEEFLIIFPNSNKYDASIIVKRILSLVRNKLYIFNDNRIQITFSAGICDVSNVNISDTYIDDLIDLADKRLYSAKESGRNKIVTEGYF